MNTLKLTLLGILSADVWGLGTPVSRALQELSAHTLRLASGLSGNTLGWHTE